MKRYTKIAFVLVVMLLMTGCFGVVDEDIYDGSLSALEITIKRNTVSTLSMSTLDGEGGNEVLVRITKTNDNGDLIYDVVKTAPLRDDKQEYSTSEMVPADKGYKITAINAAYGDLELGSATTDVPAEKVTSVDITLDKLEHLLIVPDEVYSGGDTAQFKLRPSEYQDDLRYTIYLATAPWTKNGKNSGEYLQIPEGESAWLTTGPTHHRFPEVTEPTKLYYQFRIMYDYYIPGRGYVAAYYPDIDAGEELPYVWLYPSPDWEPED